MYFQLAGFVIPKAVYAAAEIACSARSFKGINSYFCFSTRVIRVTVFIRVDIQTSTDNIDSTACYMPCVIFNEAAFNADNRLLAASACINCPSAVTCRLTSRNGTAFKYCLYTAVQKYTASAVCCTVFNSAVFKCQGFYSGSVNGSAVLIGASLAVFKRQVFERELRLISRYGEDAVRCGRSIARKWARMVAVRIECCSDFALYGKACCYIDCSVVAGIVCCFNITHDGYNAAFTGTFDGLF